MRNPDRIARPRGRAIPRVEILEDRVVPYGSALDLTTRGAVGSEGGAYFAQLAEPPGELDPFLTLRPRHFFQFTERGYNTDARPVQFDESDDPSRTRSLRVADVPVVVRGGTAYREFILDVDQWRFLPYLTLDELRLYVGDRPDLGGYAPDGTLGGQEPVYDLDGARDLRVWLHSGLNADRGPGDMALYVPAAALAGGEFVSLYSKFGSCLPATGGPEVWSVRVESGPPASIGGFVFGDVNGNMQQDDFEHVLSGRVVYLDDDDDGVLDATERSATSAEDGRYQFTDLVGGREYVVRVVTAPGEFAPRLPITPAPGEDFPLDIGVVGAQP